MIILLFILMPTFAWQEICARDGQPTYRAKTPTTWERQPPAALEQLSDTTQSNCAFLIKEDSATLRITIHTFPSQSVEERIAPAAQIARWKQQLQPLDVESVSITPQAFSGFSGFLFEGTGQMQGEHTTVLGWSMLLAPEHYRTLLNAHERQKRADFTIKAVGPKDLVARHRREIIDFARTFELIDEIPTRL